MQKTCPCGKKYYCIPALIKRKKYCSKKCFYKYRIVPIWNKGLKGIHLSPKSEFKKGITPWNKGTGKGWIDEGYKKFYLNGRPTRVHRNLMEKLLGKKLQKNEVVHHKNGYKLDNRPTNLQVLTISEHIKLHHKWRKKINKRK